MPYQPRHYTKYNHDTLKKSLYFELSNIGGFYESIKHLDIFIKFFHGRFFILS